MRCSARSVVEHPDGPVNDAVNLRSLVDADTYDIKTDLYALLGATGCLLLIACLNIANLLVARSAARSKETAIRTALGGSRMRLLREQVVESTLLSAAGGLLGLLLADGILRWLISYPRRHSARRLHPHGRCGCPSRWWRSLVVACLRAYSGAEHTRHPRADGAAGIFALAQRGTRPRTSAPDAAGARSRPYGGAADRSGLLLRSYQQLRGGPRIRADKVLTMERTAEKQLSDRCRRLGFFEQLLSRVRSAGCGGRRSDHHYPRRRPASRRRLHYSGASAPATRTGARCPDPLCRSGLLRHDANSPFPGANLRAGRTARPCPGGCR